MGKELPIIPIAGRSLAFGVFLLSYTPEPVFYLLGVHSGSTCHSAIGKLVVVSCISVSNGAVSLILVGP
jgi:hypothetical protein